MYGNTLTQEHRFPMFMLLELEINMTAHVQLCFFWSKNKRLVSSTQNTIKRDWVMERFE